MSDLSERFEERLEEIASYLELIEGIEILVRSGVPRLGEGGPSITAQQQRILNSGVYLQLYNLIEATVTNCLEAVSKTAMRQANWTARELSNGMLREWVRYLARTHMTMGSEKRLEDALLLCDHLISDRPVAEFEIERGGGGNWDDNSIKKMAERIGISLRVSRKVDQGVKRKIRNDLGAMSLVVNLRNGLAHGRLSFVECGQDDSVADLKSLTERVANYLREIVAGFSGFIEDHEYIRPENRPRPPATASG